MPMFSTPYESPAEFQWDVDSLPCTASNCGPTTITRIIVFMKDAVETRIGLVRRLVKRTCGPTDVRQQAAMLEKSGIPATYDRRTLAQVKDLVKTARRPVDAALDMSKVPDVVRLHPFKGSHSVCVLGLARAYCPFHKGIETGFWVADPNFHRDRPVHPRRSFFCDRIFEAAHSSLGSWCAYPDSPKVIKPVPVPPPATTSTATRVPLTKSVVVTAADGLNVRARPRSDSAYRGTLAKGARLTTRMAESHGGAYVMGSVTRHDWLQIVHNGQLGWIARGWTKTV